MSSNTIEGKTAKLKSIMEDFKDMKGAFEILKDGIMLDQLKVFRDLMKSMLDEFSNIFIELELMPKYQLGYDTQTFKLFKKSANLTIYDISLKMENLQNSQNTEFQPTTSSTLKLPKTTINETLQQTYQSSQPTRKVKLPEIKLPEFNGDFNSWISFKDTYTSLIHSDSSFTDIEKFHYLKSAVNIQPESQNILNNYQFSGSNYETAWSALCQRYDDRRLLLMQYINSLMTIKGPVDDSLTEARRVLDTYISHRSAFNLMKVTHEELLDMIFEQFIRDKFDKNLMREWDIHIDSSNKKPSWDALCKFMDQRIKSLSFTNREPTSLPKKISQIETTESHANGTTLLTYQVEKCKLCSNNHAIYKCEIFNREDLDGRKQLVLKHRLCMNCLRTGHSKQECKNKSRCKVCNGKHHTSIHDDQLSSSKSKEST